MRTGSASRNEPAWVQYFMLAVVMAFYAATNPNHATQVSPAVLMVSQLLFILH
jgi:hypothetical protein